jgi:hypothetical protein
MWYQEPLWLRRRPFYERPHRHRHRRHHRD